MKKTISINLGGKAFIIDEDAFEKLKKYLLAMERNFQRIGEPKDTIEDIESRMSELFKERLTTNKDVINFQDVIAVIDRVGSPDVILQDGAEFDQEVRSDRLYRSTTDRKIAGVCAGIADYFDIKDPNIIRLAFVIAVLFAGFPIIVYAVLWAVLPEHVGKTRSNTPSGLRNIADMVDLQMDRLDKKLRGI